MGSRVYCWSDSNLLGPHEPTQNRKIPVEFEVSEVFIIKRKKNVNKDAHIACIGVRGPSLAGPEVSVYRKRSSNARTTP